MKRRIVIPSSEMRPWPGESQADAIRRAIIGRPLRELSLECAKDDKDEDDPPMRSR
jgi:hypothetical protein